MKSVDFNDCILWDRATNGGGYPQVYHEGKKRLVTHLVWEEETGQAVPSGMFVCHRCDTPQCIAIDHLFLGTPRDNMLDKVAKGRGRGEFVSVDYCKRGHSLLDPQNVITHRDGRRNCRACSRIHFAEYRRRVKGNPEKYAERLEAGRIRQRQRIAEETEEQRAARRERERAQRRPYSRLAAEDPKKYEEVLAKGRVRSRAQHARLAADPEKYQARLARQRELARARKVARDQCGS